MKNKKNIKLKAIFLLILIIIAFAVHHKSGTYASDLQESIAQKIVRFHIIANSDTKEDQQLKLKVRDAILSLLKPRMEDASDFDSAVNILEESLDDIICCAQEIIAGEGYSYDVTAEVCKCYFPTKVYGDLVLPPGDYTALNVIIGNGDGHNWWCVMYPTLCFVDCTYAVLPDESKEKLQAVLTYDEYLSVMSGEDTKVSYTTHLGEWLRKIISG